MNDPIPASNEAFETALDEVVEAVMEIGFRRSLTQHQIVTALLAASISILNPEQSKPDAAQSESEAWVKAVEANARLAGIHD